MKTHWSTWDEVSLANFWAAFHICEPGTKMHGMAEEALAELDRRNRLHPHQTYNVDTRMVDSLLQDAEWSAQN